MLWKLLMAAGLGLSLVSGASLWWTRNPLWLIPIAVGLFAQAFAVVAQEKE